MGTGHHIALYLGMSVGSSESVLYIPQALHN